MCITHVGMVGVRPVQSVCSARVWAWRCPGGTRNADDHGADTGAVGGGEGGRGAGGGGAEAAGAGLICVSIIVYLKC